MRSRPRAICVGAGKLIVCEPGEVFAWPQCLEDER
jgi:hypothetical protein